MSNYWIADADTYGKLQLLKEFVSFIADLKYSTQTDKRNAIEIKSLVENINEPDTFKNWNVCLDIYDRKLQEGMDNGASGVYWRTWSVYFENDKLEIEAKTNHTDEPIYHHGDDFYYSAVIYFKKELPCDRIYMQKELDTFLADARNYQKYVTETLNDVSIDTDIF